MMTDPFLSSFESLPLDAYRRTITASVRALLAQAAIPPRHQDASRPVRKTTESSAEPAAFTFSIHRYDSNVLADSLLHQIPWKALCADHDQRILRQRQQKQFQVDKRKMLASSAGRRAGTTKEPADSFDVALTTPLRIVLDVVLNDPSTFPWAGTKSLTKALLIMFVFMDEYAHNLSGTEDRVVDPPNKVASNHVDLLGPSSEAMRCTLLRCCERIPALSLQDLLLELFEKDAPSAATESSLHGRTFPKVLAIPHLRRIWCLVTTQLKPSLSIGSASKACKLPPGQDSYYCFREMRIYVHLLLATDDVTAVQNERRLKSRTVDCNIDSEEQQDPHLSDRAGAKRRARLSLTGQQQILLLHGEIDPSVEFDSEEEEEDAHGNFLNANDPESVVANKVRQFHRYHHKGTSNRRGISNGRGQDWRTKDLISMRTKILSHILSCVKSLSSGHGMQVLNTLLIPALNAKPWSTSIRLLNVLQVAAIGRVASPTRRSPSPSLSSASLSSFIQPYNPNRRALNLDALQHLLNEVWDRVLHELACNGRRDNDRSIYVSRGSNSGAENWSSWIALLHFYAELVGECAWFDDAMILACALEPLLQALGTEGRPDNACEELDCVATHASLDPFSDQNTATQPQELLQEPPRSGMDCATVLRCALAFILSRRGASAVQHAFSHRGPKRQGGSDAWTFLTLRFCHWSDWYHEAWYEDRVRIRLALRAAGILSVFDEAVASRSKRDDPSRCRGGMRSYVSAFCHQSKALHFFVHDGNQPLFSRGSKHAGVIESPLSSRTRQEPTLPPDQHMSGDMIRHVFGFLGYKRLVRMRAVCHEWKMLADDSTLWLRLYCSRFGAPQGIVVTSPSEGEGKDLGWKSLFEGKLAAERPLRFRRHSSGWKIRTCRFVGCLHVLTTPGLAVRHEKTHLKSRPSRSKRQRRLVSPTSEWNKRKKTLAIM